MIFNTKFEISYSSAIIQSYVGFPVLVYCIYILFFHRPLSFGAGFFRVFMTPFQDIVKTQFLQRPSRRKALALKAWTETDEQVGIVCIYRDL